MQGGLGCDCRSGEGREGTLAEVSIAGDSCRWGEGLLWALGRGMLRTVPGESHRREEDHTEGPGTRGLADKDFEVMDSKGSPITTPRTLGF